MRVEIEARTIFVADPRDMVIRKRFQLLQKVEKVMRHIVPGAWSAKYFHGLPLNNDPTESAVLMCLNVASFAFHSPKEHDEEEGFQDVFSYEATN